MPEVKKLIQASPSNATGVIVRNAKGQFIQQPSKEVRGENAHRPTDYNDEVQAQFDAWITDKITNKQIAWIEEFAVNLGTSDRTLERWNSATNDDGTKKYPKFCRTYDLAFAWQKMVLKNNGISGKFNSRMTMFLLSANHETVEKREVKSDLTSGGKPLDLTAMPRAINPMEFNAYVAQRLEQNYTEPNR